MIEQLRYKAEGRDWAGSDREWGREGERGRERERERWIDRLKLSKWNSKESMRIEYTSNKITKYIR